MNPSIFFLVLAINLVSVFSQDPPNICTQHIAFGKACGSSQPTIRYHFDNDTRLCMAFEFEGCESNENNFLSDSECKASCTPTDNVGCPVNSKPLTKEDGSNLCQQSEDCVPEGFCSKRLSGGGKCCRKAIRKKLNADYAPACGTRREPVSLENNQVLIGKNCQSNFCPPGSKCRKGTYFSTCCRKI